MTDIFISRTDDLSFVDKLFDPVCGPAGDTGDSKDRGVELFWKAKHCVDETAVEINICTDWFEQTALFGDTLAGNAFYRLIASKFFLAVLLSGKLLCIFFQNHTTWIGQCINSMAHTIDKTSSIECFTIKYFGQVGAQFVFVLPVCNILFNIFKHLHNLQVGTAVARSF